MNGDLNQTGILYLCKQINQEIYVDIQSLSQNHIDGIRFLYLQFKKKYAGVILNDPPGLGKCLLTVYFLTAVQHSLDKPILIIASDDKDLLKWMELFQKLGVDVESKNPLTKKQVFVTITSKITLFNVKEWSIVVIHNNQASKEIIQTNFKCEFKIWITSVDLKLKLKTLQSVYNWLTNEELDIKQFTPDNDPYDIVKKSMLLDIFLEDIYCRSSNIFKSVTEDAASEIAITKRNTYGSRRNKDATGTKIKKSKRRLNDEDLPDVSNDELFYKGQDNMRNKEKNINTEDFASDDELFYKGQENMRNKEKNINTEDFASDDELFYKGQENMRNKEKNINTEDFASDANTSKVEYPRIDDAISPTLLTANSYNAQYEHLEELTRIKRNDIKCNEPIEKQNTLKMDSQNIFSFGHAIQDIVDNENNIGNASKTQDENICSFVHTTQDKVNNENKQIKKASTEEENINLNSETDLPNNISVPDDADSPIKNEMKNADKSSQSIDTKLLELEEMALKKFKGTFLDSIF